MARTNRDRIRACELTLQDRANTGVLNAATIFGDVARVGRPTPNAERLQTLVYGELLWDGTTDFVRDLFGGQARILNGDGALDDWHMKNLSKTPMSAALIEAFLTDAPASSTVLNGYTESAAIDQEALSIFFKDQALLLDTPICTQIYAGNNNGVSIFLEGADELAGKRKPQLLGDCFNITPVCVNAAKLIYQFNSNVIPGTNTVLGVSDQGIAYISSGTYATQADLLNDALAPAAGRYKAYLAGGMIRIGSVPLQLTMNANCEPTNGFLQSRIFDLSNALFKQFADLAALGITGPGSTNVSAGLYITDATTYREALMRVAFTGGCFFSGTNLVLARFANPAAWVSTQDFVDGNHMLAGSLERLRIEGAGDSFAPAWRVTVRTRPNYTVMKGAQVAAGASQAVRENLGSDFVASHNASDVAVKTAYPNARDIVIDCPGASAGNAGALPNNDGSTLASIWLAMLKVPRGLYRFDAPIQFFNQRGLGDIVTLYSPRFGLSGGKPTMIVGRSLDTSGAGKCTLTCWG